MPRHRRAGPEIKQRGEVWYAVEYSLVKGRSVWTSLRTKDAGEARLRFANYLVRGSGDAVGYADVTVDQVLDWYVQDHVQRKVVDKQRQLDAIANLRVFFGDTAVGEVDVVMSQAYAAARRAGHVKRERKRNRSAVASNSTIRRELVVLVAAVNHAIFVKKLPKGSEVAVELPAEDRVHDAAPWITKSVLLKAIENAKGPLRDFILLAYYTAARRRSIEYLTKGQVDLKHGRINLQPINSPRTNKRKPIVPVYPEIRPVLERLMVASATDYVFGEPVSFYRPFVDLMADLGVEAHPHLLRHSRATHMLMDGEDPYKVAKLLGDTLTTVERRYGHASVDYLNTSSGLETA